MKKFLSMLLSVALIVSMLSVSIPGIFAMDGETPQSWDDSSQIADIPEIPSKTIKIIPKDQSDSSDAFAAYVNRELGLTPPRRGVVGGEAALSSENDRAAYRALEPLIKKVAKGEESSTVFEVTPADLGFAENKFYANDLGVDSLLVKNGSNYSISTQAVTNLRTLLGFDYETVVLRLMYSMPADLYWFDKTQGYSYSSLGIGYDYENGDIFNGYLYCTTNQKVYLTVGSEFALNGAQYEANTEVGKSVQATIDNANAIVKKYAAKSDYGKVLAYKDEICNFVTYNSKAAEGGIDYGNPWQLIWVFDNNPETNVVCEGYAKAFQYLCDLSTFKSPDVACITVSGMMSGGTGAGAHMWNILSMDDNVNYLVDITNVDSGTAGYPDYLFLKGVSGSVDGGYVASCPGVDIAYSYDSETFSIYNNESLTLSANDYEPFDEPFDNELVAYVSNTQDSDASLLLSFGSSETLSVDASCKSGEISYQWYKQERVWNEENQVYNYVDQEIEGANESSYTIDTADSVCTYRCEVSDEYDNQCSVSFYISIDNELNAYVSGTEETYASLSLRYGSSETLSVDASCLGGAVSYRWYKQERVWNEENQEYDYTDREIEGATESTFTIDTADSVCIYRCEVSDEYDNQCSVSFYIGIDSELNAYASGTGDTYSSLLLWPGSSTTLSVEASNLGGAISYRWYKQERVWSEENQEYDYTNREIEGATESTFTIDNVDSVCLYRCDIRDEYDNQCSVSFDIKIDNNLSAYVSGTNDDFDYYELGLGSSVTLSVDASCNHGTISYQWYKGERIWDDENNDYKYDYQLIEGITGSTYFVESADSVCSFRCDVADEYENQCSVRFSIFIDNELKAYVSGTNDETGSVSLALGSSGTLSVDAFCTSGTISYQWYKRERLWNEEDQYHYYENRIIEGATDSSYTIENFDSVSYYLCRVSDEYANNCSVLFIISIDNNLKAYVSGTESDRTSLALEPGSSELLSVDASCTNGAISYQWRQMKEVWNDEFGYYETTDVQIEGATSATYLLENISDPGTYTCYVTDEYNSNVCVYFDISVDNNLRAHVSGTDSDNTSLSLSPGSSETLSVDASCISGAISYMWQTRALVWDEDFQDYFYNTLTINGATESSYTIESVDGVRSYWCVVRDEYDNQCIVSFYINVDNELKAYASGTEETNVNVGVTFGESNQLGVDASCLSGDLSYRWYRIEKVWSDEFGYYETIDVQIEGATSPTYLLENVSAKAEYRCCVNDEYENSAWVCFDVVVDNNLKAYVSGTERSFASLSVAHGSSGTLSVDASCLNGDLSYRWYRIERVWSDEFEYYETIDVQIEDATSPRYLLENVSAKAEYRCCVTDKYGNDAWVYFDVAVDNNLKAYVSGTERNFASLSVAYGSSETLSVDASCTNGTVSYQWYKDERVWNEEQQTYYNDVLTIDGATESSYTIESADYTCSYWCDVRDEYDNQCNVSFYISIDNRLIAYVSGTKKTEVSVSVPFGGSTELSVDASCANGPISYQWTKSGYVWNEEQQTYYYDVLTIDGATESSYTVENVDQAWRYFCLVGDEYNNQRNVSFEVSIENNLKAYVSGTEDNYVSIALEIGSSKTLSVDASCERGTISYRWYKIEAVWDETLQDTLYINRIIEGATGSSYTIENFDSACTYRCDVRDEFNNLEHVQFGISIENNLRAFVSGTENHYIALSLALGSSKTLSVDASCAKGAISYQWRQHWRVWDEERLEYGYEIRVIKGANNSTYTIENVDSDSVYECYVEDEYGNRDIVFFDVIIAGEAEAITTVDIGNIWTALDPVNIVPFTTEVHDELDDDGINFNDKMQIVDEAWIPVGINAQAITLSESGIPVLGEQYYYMIKLTARDGWHFDTNLVTNSMPFTLIIGGTQVEYIPCFGYGSGPGEVSQNNIGQFDTDGKSVTLIIVTNPVPYVTIEPVDISAALVKPVEVKMYDGTAQTQNPNVTIEVNGTSVDLVNGTDYTMSYKNNKAPGALASVTVTGKGNYTGSKTEQFRVCFTDVPMTHSYQKDIYWAVDEGIAAGYGQSTGKYGRFGVSDNITRGQVVMFLWRAAGKPEPKANTQTFSDIPTTHSFYKAIQWASEQKITTGYTSGANKGKFGVNDNCTRGQIVAFLWRYAGRPAPKGSTQTFSDVPTTHSFYEAIQWASEQKITSGFSDGSFGVTKTCTRGQCMRFLSRLLQ